MGKILNLESYVTTKAGYKSFLDQRNITLITVFQLTNCKQIPFAIDLVSNMFYLVLNCVLFHFYMIFMVKTIDLFIFLCSCELLCPSLVKYFLHFLPSELLAHCLFGNSIFKMLLSLAHRCWTSVDWHKFFFVFSLMTDTYINKMELIMTKSKTSFMLIVYAKNSHKFSDT